MAVSVPVTFQVMVSVRLDLLQSFCMFYFFFLYLSLIVRLFDGF